MELNYKFDNEKEFKNFVESLNDRLKNYKPKIPKDTHHYAVIFELRSVEYIKNIIKNHLYFLNETDSNIKWGLQIVHGTNNENFIKNELKDWDNVIYTNLNIENINDRFEHTKILKTIDFWEKIKGDKILLFQTDSLLLRSGIDEFLKYDYIGAPWKKPKEGNFVGNGGLSLRTKSKMFEILKKYPNDNTMMEDIYFSKYIENDLIADIETAKKFSVEDVYYENPFGIHRIEKIETVLLKKLLENSVPNYTI